MAGEWFSEWLRQFSSKFCINYSIWPLMMTYGSCLVTAMKLVIELFSFATYRKHWQWLLHEPRS